MIPTALVLIISLARGSQPDPPRHDLQLMWVASADVSSTTGPFNVRFIPRYPSLLDAPVVRDRDLAAFTAELSVLDGQRRTLALETLQRRLDAVRHWESQFGAAVSDPLVETHRRIQANEQRQLLLLEASTLELQLGMLGEEAPAHDTDSEDDDRVSIGSPLVIGADERVRSAVVIGADLVVEGVVLEDAVAVMGNIVVVPGAKVDGNAVVVGGKLEVDPGARVARRQAVATHAADRPSSPWRSLSSRLLSFLTFSGIGALTVGLFPAQVGRIAAYIDIKPIRSLLAGLFGLPGVLLTSALAALTILGIPVALVLLGVLGASAVLGLVATCQALGDRLPFTIPHGRWLALAGTSAALANFSDLPALLQLAVLAASAGGLGAALSARLGRAPA